MHSDKDDIRLSSTSDYFEITYKQDLESAIDARIAERTVDAVFAAVREGHASHWGWMGPRIRRKGSLIVVKAFHAMHGERSASVAIGESQTDINSTLENTFGPYSSRDDDGHPRTQARPSQAEGD